uniref:Uncharacterized protein n=1 Tax=Ciona intestinalis TaxID=7719 RepID=H2Y051_CIOIN
MSMLPGIKISQFVIVAKFQSWIVPLFTVELCVLHKYLRCVTV